MAPDQTSDPVDSFASRVIAVGYRSLTEAIADTKKMLDARKEYEVQAGPLFFDTDWLDKFKTQIRATKEIVFSFLDIPGKSDLERTLNLGRLRALANIAALSLGYYIPAFATPNGKFEKLQQDGMDYDRYGTRYRAVLKARPELFWKLSSSDKRDLVKLAKRH